MAHWTDGLVSLGACNEAVRWAGGYDSLAEAWQRCQRGDHMLWLAGRLAGPPGDDSRRPLVLAACECAELSLPLIRDDNVRPVAEATIQTAQAWAHGEATIEDVRVAQRECCNAAAAAAANAAYAAGAAAAAADAANDANAAYAASYAAAAADAAYAADVSRDHILAHCADIVRRHYPTPPTLVQP